jgi:hypothetical protein
LDFPAPQKLDETLVQLQDGDWCEADRERFAAYISGFQIPKEDLLHLIFHWRLLAWLPNYTPAFGENQVQTNKKAPEVSDALAISFLNASEFESKI